MSIPTILTLLALGLSIVTVIWVVRAVKKPESLTREGFAFRAMTAYLAFCALLQAQ